MALMFSLVGVAIIGLISLLAALVLFVKDKIFHKLLIFFVSLSAGALLGSAFFHLLPEALEGLDNSLVVFLFAIIGFCFFFILERFLRWRHCHEDGCQSHSHIGWINLVGDGIHNFIDGLVVFAAFSIDFNLGIIVLVTILSHELPQEIGDFGVLIYSGFSKSRAIIYNLLSALAGIGGVLVAYLFGLWGNGVPSNYLLPLAAGGFIYIAASDLIPELHKDKNNLKSVASFAVFVLAVMFMFWLKIYFE